MDTVVAPIAKGLPDAVKQLWAGGLVAFPTETVYGLGADARSEDAVRRIYEAKGRPSGNPIIVHVANVGAARAVTGEWPAAAERLAASFWPGPLTMILRRGAGISALVAAGRETVALRCPAHPVAQALLKEFGGPIAAPSANRSGFTSPTTAQHVYAELAGRVPLILDGGACEIGVESTVVDLTADPPRILRPGAITAELLREVIGPVETVRETVREEDSAASPGQHSRHYAPRTPAFRFTRAEWAACGGAGGVGRMAGLFAAGQLKAVLLTHDPAISLPAPHETMVMPADAAAYARKLYASLRAADELGAAAILVLTPDHVDGMWAAVLDRLSRATEPFGRMRGIA